MSVNARPEVAEQIKRERANTAMTAVRLAYRRGHAEEAFRQCREVLLIDDTHAEAHEVMGDLLRDQNKDEAALEEYRRALELDPNRASAEEKVGIIAIERDGLLRFEQRRMTLVADATKRQLEERKPGIAALLSALIPGGGQWYNEDQPRACLIFGVAMASLFLSLYPTINAWTELTRQATTRTIYYCVRHPEVAPEQAGVCPLCRLALAAKTRPRKGGQLPSPGALNQKLQERGTLFYLWILLNSFVCAGVWIYGIAEAAQTAQRENKFWRKHLGIE